MGPPICRICWCWPINQAIEQSQLMAAKRMEAITGGLGDIPGLSGLLGG